MLFLGFALMAGGLAGSVTVMVLKYLVRDEAQGEGASFMTLWLGVANVVGNGLVMLRYVLRCWFVVTEEVADRGIYSSIVLWVSQNMEDDYTYNLAL